MTHLLCFLPPSQTLETPINSHYITKEEKKECSYRFNFHLEFVGHPFVQFHTRSASLFKKVMSSKFDLNQIKV